MDALALRAMLRDFPRAEKLHPLRRGLSAEWVTEHLREPVALPSDAGGAP